jgi:hypothetical protein
MAMLLITPVDCVECDMCGEKELFSTALDAMRNTHNAAGIVPPIHQHCQGMIAGMFQEGAKTSVESYTYLRCRVSFAIIGFCIGIGIVSSDALSAGELRTTAVSTRQDGSLKYMRLSHLMAKQMFVDVRVLLLMEGVVDEHTPVVHQAASGLESVVSFTGRL